MYQHALKNRPQQEQADSAASETSKNHVKSEISIPPQTITPNKGQEKHQPLPIKPSDEQRRLAPAPVKPNKTGIPLQMKEGFERISGFSFDNVRVHYNSDKPAQLQALAYTRGNQVHVGPGQEMHLGHELGHVVQQKQGKVPATNQRYAVDVNDDPALESEADLLSKMAQIGKKDEQAGDERRIPIPIDYSPELRLVGNDDDGVAQLVSMAVRITGITHAVKISEEGSIFDGDECEQLQDGDEALILTDQSIWSRRGPNQELVENRTEDRSGPQIYEWYPIQEAIVGGEHKVYGGQGVYLRDETFIIDRHQLRGDGGIRAGAQEALRRALKKGGGEKVAAPAKGAPFSSIRGIAKNKLSKSDVGIVRGRCEDILSLTQDQSLRDALSALIGDLRVLEADGRPEPAGPQQMTADNAIKSLNAELTRRRKEDAPPARGNKKNLFFQSMGNVFETFAAPYIKLKHPNCEVLESVKPNEENFARMKPREEGGALADWTAKEKKLHSHELDFVVIQGSDVIIYSAKIDPSQFDPKTDLAHWDFIRPINYPGREFNAPLVLLVSPETFGLDRDSFAGMLVPGWDDQLRE